MPPAYPAFSCPLSPRPPSPAGKGEIFSFLMQGASPLASPGLNPGGTGAGGESRAGGGVPSESPTRCKTDRTAFLLAVPAAKERGDRGRWNYPSHATTAFEMVLSPGADRASAAVACLLCRLPTPPLAYFPAPYPPDPLPQRGRGRLKVYFAGGGAPGTPGVEPGRHRSRGRTTHPAGVCLRNRQLAAKPTEFLYLERCRKPRREGTGGEELRRLRWSSPPGQVEQMPHGGQGSTPKAGLAGGKGGKLPPL